MTLKAAAQFAIGLIGAVGSFTTTRLFCEMGDAPTTSSLRSASEPTVRVEAAAYIHEPGRPLGDSATGLSGDAKEALREGPLNADALTILWLAEQRRQSSPHNDDLLRLAERVSRRSSLLQLAALESSARKGDIGGALGHIDRLITVNPETQAAFYPIMMRALEEPEATTLFLGWQSRGWFIPFLGFAISQSPEVTPVAKLVNQITLAEEPRTVVLKAMIARLLADGALVEAQTFAANYTQSSKTDLADFRLTKQTLDTRLVPLTWEVATDAAQSELDGSEVALDFAIPPLRNVQLLRRRTAFSPGSYQLDQIVSNRPGSSPVDAVWSMHCSAETQPKWQQFVPVTDKRVNYRSNVLIGTDCPDQLWLLSSSSEDRQFEGGLHLEKLNLERLQAGAKLTRGK